MEAGGEEVGRGKKGGTDLGVSPLRGAGLFASSPRSQARCGDSAAIPDALEIEAAVVFAGGRGEIGASVVVGRRGGREWVVGEGILRIPGGEGGPPRVRGSVGGGQRGAGDGRRRWAGGGDRGGPGLGRRGEGAVVKRRVSLKQRVSLVRQAALERKASLVRRSPLQGSSVLQRSEPVSRQTPLRAVNRERLEKRREEQFGPKADWIRRLACSMCGAPGPSDPSHVRSRGAGGTAADLIPQCWMCHRRLHDVGRWTFETEMGVDLVELVERYEELWRRVAG